MAETIHYPEVNRNAVFSDNFDFNVAPCQAKRQITEHMGSSKQLGRNSTVKVLNAGQEILR